ncbi:MAG: hypothetical protein RSB77_04600 [Bacilli bacterium]
MKEEFYKIFNGLYDIDSLQWSSSFLMTSNKMIKTSKIENVMKYPISESKESTSMYKRWSNLLGLDDLSIDNINNILYRYNLIAKNNLKSTEKKGYILNQHNLLVVYNDQKLITSLRHDNQSTYITSCLTKNGQLDLLPLFYVMNYNLYNLFFIGSEPITFFDKELETKIEVSLNNTNSIKETLIHYANLPCDYITYKIIRDYFNKSTTFTENDIKRYIKHLETEITKISRERNKITKEIEKLEKENEEINKDNKQEISKIRNLNNFIAEFNILKNLEDDNKKQNKIDKFIKNNTDLFIEYSRTPKKYPIEKFIQNKIMEEYKNIKNYPETLKERIEYLKNTLNNDILGTYIIGINYFLIMALIRLSNNIEESIYEGNLINKTFYNVKELINLIELINKNLID